MADQYTYSATVQGYGTITFSSNQALNDDQIAGVAARIVNEDKKQQAKYASGEARMPGNQLFVSKAEQDLRTRKSLLEAEIRRKEAAGLDATAGRRQLASMAQDLREYNKNPGRNATPQEWSRYEALSNLELRPEEIARRLQRAGINTVELSGAIRDARRQGAAAQDSIGLLDRVTQSNPEGGQYVSDHLGRQVPLSDAIAAVSRETGFTPSDVIKIFGGDKSVPKPVRQFRAAYDKAYNPGLTAKTGDVAPGFLSPSRVASRLAGMTDTQIDQAESSPSLATVAALANLPTNVASGLTGFTGGLAGIPEMFGAPATDFRRSLQEYAGAIGPTPDQPNAGGLTKAINMIGQRGAVGLGSMLPTILPGAGAAKLATLAEGISPLAARGIGASSDALISAASNTGDNYGQAVDAGVPRDVAFRRALMSGAADAITNTITNRLGLYGEGGGRLRRIVSSALAEGGEEVENQVSGNYVTKGKLSKDLLEGTGESFILGSLLGAGADLTMHGGHEAALDPKAPLLSDAARERLTKSPFASNPVVQHVLNLDQKYRDKAKTRPTRAFVQGSGTDPGKVDAEVYFVESAAKRFPQVQQQLASLPQEGYRYTHGSSGLDVEVTKVEDGKVWIAPVRQDGTVDPRQARPANPDAFSEQFSRSQNVPPMDVLEQKIADVQRRARALDSSVSKGGVDPQLARFQAAKLEDLHNHLVSMRDGLQTGVDVAQATTEPDLVQSVAQSPEDQQPVTVTGSIPAEAPAQASTTSDGLLPVEVPPTVVQSPESASIENPQPGLSPEDEINALKGEIIPALGSTPASEAAPAEPGRGKAAILETLDKAKADLFAGDDRSHKLARDFVESLPDSALSKLGLEVRDQTGDGSVKGMYLGDRDIAAVIKNVGTNHPQGAAYTVAHEISHHLEKLLPEGVRQELYRQFRSEQKSGKFESVERQKAYGKLSDADRFSEWFAHSIASTGLRTVEKENLPLWRRVVAHISDFADGVAKFFLRRGQLNKAAQVYRAMRNGAMAPTMPVDRILYNIEKSGAESVWPQLERMSTLVLRLSDDATYESWRSKMEEHLGKGKLTEANLQTLYAVAQQNAFDGQGSRAQGLEVEDRLVSQGIPFDADVATTPLRTAAHADEAVLRSAFPDMKDATVDGKVRWAEEIEKARKSAASFKGEGGITYAEQLASKVNGKAEHPLTASEQIAIGMDVADKRVAYLSITQRQADLIDQLRSEKDEGKRETIEAQLRQDEALRAKLVDDMEGLLDALNRSGSILGRALNARKLILDHTFDTPELFERVAQAKKQRSLTKSEQIDVQEMSSDIAKAKQQLAIGQTLNNLKKLKEKLESRVRSMGDVESRIKQTQARIDAAKAEIDRLKQQRRALNKNEKSAQREEDRLRDLISKHEDESERLERYILRLKSNPDYSGPGIDIADLYEQELQRIGNELSEAKDPERILKLSAEFRRVQDHLAKGSEYLDTIWTGSLTPDELHQRAAQRGEGLDRSPFGVGETKDDPWLTKLREAYEGAAAEIKDTADQARTVRRIDSFLAVAPLYRRIVSGDEAAIKERDAIKAKAEAGDEEAQRQYAFLPKDKGESGGSEALQRLQNELSYLVKDSTLRGKLTGLIAEVESGGYTAGPTARPAQPMDAALKELRDMVSQKKRELNLRSRLEDLMHALDTGTLVREPKIEREPEDPKIKALQDQLSEAKKLANAYLSALEPQNPIESLRHILRANAFTNMYARVVDVAANTAKLVTERNPLSMAADHAFDRALFPRLYSKSGSAISGGLLAGFSPTRELEIASKTWSRRTFGEIRDVLRYGDQVYFEGKYGVGGLRLAAKTDKPGAKAILARIDGLVNWINRTPATTDVPFRVAYKEGVTLDMVDAMVAHMGKEARRQGIPFDENAKRKELLRNENGEIDDVIAMAEAEADAAVFSNKDVTGTGLSQAWSPEMWRRLLSNAGASDERASTYSHASVLALETLITRFPRIFGKIIGYGTDFAGGAGKAAVAVASKKTHGEEISIGDRRRVVALIRRNLVGVAMYALAGMLWNDDELGRYDKERNVFDWSQYGFPEFGLTIDQLGGPINVALLAIAKHRVEKLVEKREITSAAANSAMEKAYMGFIFNQPIVSGTDRLLGYLTGRTDSLGKFAGSVAANAVVPGVIRASARQSDVAQTGVSIRDTSADTFAGEVANRFREAFPTTRLELPRSKAGVIYPKLTQDEQEEFRRLNYSPAEIAVGNARDEDPEKFAAMVPLIREVTTGYIKRTIGSAAYKALPDLAKNNVDKYHMLRGAITDARGTARAIAELKLNQDAVDVLQKYGVGLPSSLSQKGKDESDEVYEDRKAAAKKLLEEKMVDADRAGLIDKVPADKRKEFLDKTISRAISIVSLPAKAPDKERAALQKMTPGKRQDAIDQANLLGAILGIGR